MGSEAERHGPPGSRRRPGSEGSPHPQRAGHLADLRYVAGTGVKVKVEAIDLGARPSAQAVVYPSFY